jgi:hypothetical protein
MTNYMRGFEDAIELVLTLLESKRKPDLKKELKKILGLLKEKKFERIRLYYLTELPELPESSS